MPSTTIPVHVHLAHLNEEEQAVMDHILAAMQGILDLGLRADSTNLRIELAAHVHGLQQFPIQHMLQRLAPDQWGTWFVDDQTVSHEADTEPPACAADIDHPDRWGTCHA